MDALNVYNIYRDWQKEHGDIHFVVMGDIEFYFRLITRKEYQLLKRMEGNDFKVDEMVAEVCVIEPIVEDWTDEIYAGFVSTLSRVILEESLIIPKGNQSEGYIESVVSSEYDNVMNNFELQMPAIIAKAFPAYTLETIDSWPLSKQIKRYAQAIYVLNNIDNYGINFIEEE